jgi:DNA-binding transcriptional MocR family regulator
MVKQRAAMIICPDKINQQRHLQFLSNTNQIKEHMRLHAKIIKPKFSLIQEKLSSIPSEIGSFKIPKGGYFVSFNTKLPIATRVVEIANSLGVKFTPAGATFPYGKDPGNSNIRIAPSFLNIQDLSVAMDVFLLSLKLAHQEVN